MSSVQGYRQESGDQEQVKELTKAILGVIRAAHPFSLGENQVHERLCTTVAGEWVDFEEVSDAICELVIEGELIWEEPPDWEGLLHYRLPMCPGGEA